MRRKYYDKARAARQRHGASTQRIGRLEQKISKIEALNDELRQIHYPGRLE